MHADVIEARDALDLDARVSAAVEHASRVMERYGRWAALHRREVVGFAVKCCGHVRYFGAVGFQSRHSDECEVENGLRSDGSRDGVSYPVLRPMADPVRLNLVPSYSTADPVLDSIERGEYVGERFYSLAEMDSVGVSR